MFVMLLATGFLCFCGLVSLAAGNRPGRANAIGAGGAFLGCLAGIVPAVEVLWTGQTLEMRTPWEVPCGSFFMQMDALSAFFLIPVLVLSALSALYGVRYMAPYGDRKNLGAFWFFFNLLVAGMIGVIVARNGVLFLVLWEVMSMASFFLVTFENEEESVRRAGWTYLVATHLGTGFLFVLFLILGGQSGSSSLDFDSFVRPGVQMAPVAGAAFLCAVVGFGTKAGFIPFHVWLPEAHPAAPSPVSAVMSGVMIKTGIYGLVRTLTFLGNPEPWWGGILIGIGLVSGILGVLCALAQHDLKRLLAYHSVENIGIIAFGLGLGVLGLGLNVPGLAVLGFGGGLLHVVNHAFFKGLLFLGAGAVAHATGTRDIDHLGGLIKRMPWTAAAFLVGAAAICGLPPLNGFVSEFLLYIGAFRSVGTPGLETACGVTIVGLALIGGLALACFTKAFGIIFLGEPRSEHAMKGHEAGWLMRIPMLLLAMGCVAIGLLAPRAVGMTQGAVGVVTGLASADVQKHMESLTSPLTSVVWIGILFIVLIVLFAGVRKALLAGRTVRESGTWDCGYTRPTARMQYTASSFAQPLTKMFEVVLRPRCTGSRPAGLFPVPAAFGTETEDVFRHNLYRPVFQGVEWCIARLRFLQEGRVQLYILYIALTLLVLLIWNLR